MIEITFSIRAGICRHSMAENGPKVTLCPSTFTYPTDRVAVLEPQNPFIKVSGYHKNYRSTDSEALKL